MQKKLLEAEAHILALESTLIEADTTWKSKYEFVIKELEIKDAQIQTLTRAIERQRPHIPTPNLINKQNTNYYNEKSALQYELNDKSANSYH